MTNNTSSTVPKGSSDDKKLPWPEKGDKLFIAGDDWWHNACLNYAHDDWELYVIGYKTAGDVLVKHAMDAREDLDVLIFPIVFVYRQYLELRLKELIKASNELLDISSNFPTNFPSTHKLSILWTQCKPLLEKIEPNARKDLDAIDEAIAEFNTQDPDSVSFRYSIDKKGAPSLRSDLQHINVRHLAEVMEKLGVLLDAASTKISVYADHKRDMQDY